MTDLPLVGLGTMGVESPDVVRTAIEMGYRHLDTAQVYENERVVGDGIAAADVPREELFVATKVWATNLAGEDVLATTSESLDRLGLDYVDLLYVHRPIEAYDPAETLAAFDRLVDEGLVRHVGVSNFSPDDLAAATSHLDSPLFANQVEFHPLFRPADALDHAQANDYHLVAYSPLAGGAVFDIPELSRVADEQDTSEAAVAIAWLLAKDNVVTIPKASSQRHLAANLAATDLELDDADLAAIENVDRREELFPD
jgi:2,5-diketo-D-gluconate reductase B